MSERKKSNKKKIHVKITRCRKVIYDLSKRQRSRLEATLRTRNKDDSSECSQAENDLESNVENIVETCSTPNMLNSISPVNDENVFDDDDVIREFSEVPHDRGIADSDSDADRVEIDEEEIEEENFDTLQNFESKLTEVFLSTNMSHVQGNAVLKVLRSHGCFSNLKIDVRSLLKTPRRRCELQQVSGGEYLHLGFVTGLLSILHQTPAMQIPEHLLIDFHIDGATLDSFGKIQIWPIQIRIVNIPKSKPEIVGIWRGSSKPINPSDFFEHFVSEVLQTVDSNGIEFNGVRKTIELRCFIADAPARALILNHVAHNARVPCSKCWIVGECLRPGVMTLRGVNHKPRTVEEYIQCLDGEHHKEGNSCLSRLPMQIPTQVPYEYMYPVLLGVMEKIESGLIDGKYSPLVKLTPRFKKLLSERLERVKYWCPREFSRKPTSIIKFKKFKATEQRQILCYSGPAVFAGIVHPLVYSHFMLLNLGIRILCKPSVSDSDLSLAHSALCIFINHAENIYGPHFLTYNTHSLSHLVEDVKRFGPLDAFSAFPYENNMMYFRRCCRKPNQHLQQIANRRIEFQQRNATRKNDNVSVRLIGKHKNGPLLSQLPVNVLQFSTYKSLDFCIGINDRDNTIILDDLSICVVRNVILMDDDYCFLVNVFSRVESLTDILVPSDSTGIFRCSLLSYELHLIQLPRIHGKCFRYAVLAI